MGTQQQVHAYARQLQAQKKYDEALEVFRINIKKDPNSWVGAPTKPRGWRWLKAITIRHWKEMKLSQAGLPDALKPQVDAILKRLENKDDINK